MPIKLKKKQVRNLSEEMIDFLVRDFQNPIF